MSLVTRTLHFWDDRCSYAFSLSTSVRFEFNDATSFEIYFDWDKYVMKGWSRSAGTATDRTWAQYCSSLKCLHDLSHFLLLFWDTIITTRGMSLLNRVGGVGSWEAWVAWVWGCVGGVGQTLVWVAWVHKILAWVTWVEILAWVEWVSGVLFYYQKFRKIYRKVPVLESLVK